MPLSSSSLSRRSLIAIAAALGAGGVVGIRAGLAEPPDVARHEAAPDSASATPAVVSGRTLFDRAYDPGTAITSDIVNIATFADFERQTQALGLARPLPAASDDEKSDWFYAMIGLAATRDMSYFAVPEFAEFCGFDPTQIHQSMEIGDPPATVTMYAGEFDRDTATAAWLAAGYKEIQNDSDLAIYSLFEDDEMDITNPLQKIFFARHNNAAFIGDDLIVFAPTLDLLQSAVKCATGGAPSLGQAPGVAALLSSSPELVSCMIVPGGAIMTSPIGISSTPEEAATAVAEAGDEAQMPPVILALVGLTPGGPLYGRSSDLDSTPVPTPETAQMQVSLLTLSADAAQQIIEIAGERLETETSQRTGQPFNEIFSSWDLSVAPDQPVALLTLELGDAHVNIWYNLLFSRDLGFIG